MNKIKSVTINQRTQNVQQNKEATSCCLSTSGVGGIDRHDESLNNSLKTQPPIYKLCHHHYHPRYPTCSSSNTWLRYYYYWKSPHYAMAAKSKFIMEMLKLPGLRLCLHSSQFVLPCRSEIVLDHPWLLLESLWRKTFYLYQRKHVKDSPSDVDYSDCLPCMIHEIDFCVIIYLNSIVYP